MAESPVAIGAVLAGKYRVERLIGSGAMGVVVSAWHMELEQRVAIKFLSPLAQGQGGAAERFRREARAAAKIRSEHVTRVLDVGFLDSALPYMVMEHLDGRDIAEELQQRGALPVAEAVDFMLQALEAIAEAHAAGIVHRDLKPANLFLATRPDGSRQVKVLDFGISKSLDGSVADLALTKTASLMGSPLYMSPEQMRSARDVDARSDIWSIGAVLYEMLTGRPPYLADSIPALCTALINDTPAPLDQLRPDLPQGLNEVVLRCLSKEADQRFVNVSDLARALLPFGTFGSRIHVERAMRVLPASEPAPGVTDPPANEAVPTDPQIALKPSTNPGSPAADAREPTVNSWGRSHAQLRRTGSRGLGFGALALLGVAVGAGVFWLRRAESEPHAASAASAPTLEAKPTGLSVTPSALAPRVEPEAAPAVTPERAETAEPPDRAATASGRNAAVPVAAPAGASPRAPGSPAAVAPKPASVPAPLGRPAAPASTSTSPAAPAAERPQATPPKPEAGAAPGPGPSVRPLSDFGGRR